MPTVYGIIGYPLKHSFSPGYFADKFAKEGIDAVYKTFELADINTFPHLISNTEGLRGLNITIPHKRAIIPYLDELDSEAERIGAVNCIIVENGKTKGYNTDILGFGASLQPLLQVHHKQALILGTGGSSETVAHTLGDLGIASVKVSREKKEGCLTYSELNEELIDQCKLIVNTTPAGMYPATDKYPAIPYEGIGGKHLLYDLIYNPQMTLFLAHGKDRGAEVKNGLEMLHLQADASWQIWNNQPTV